MTHVYRSADSNLKKKNFFLNVFTQPLYHEQDVTSSIFNAGLNLEFSFS